MSADPFDARLARRAGGVLAAANRAGVLTGADVHVAATLGRLTGECDERVLLAAGCAVRAVRLGSVCVDLAEVGRSATADAEDSAELAELTWPDPDAWLAACLDSRLVAAGPAGEADRPLRLVDGLLYLDRYWRQEQHVRAELDARTAAPPPVVDRQRLHDALDRLWADPADFQRRAVAACLTGWLTVVAGGPGTGKTTTIARLLAVLDAVLDPPPRVALGAPTGKAAARLQEAVAAERRPVGAATLHRLLGWRPDSRGRFRHDRSNRLPYDVVVVDETSMVSLTMMSRLLEAVRPDARLVLVGDPDQLASVEAGAVLGDLVARPAQRSCVVRLATTYRYGGTIAVLAEAVRSGDADAVLAALRSAQPDVEFVETDSVAQLRRDVEDAGFVLAAAASRGDVPGALAALDEHRLLCAHRRGPYGVARWTAEVQRWLADTVDGNGDDSEWYAGRPLLVTANDYELGLYNGDTGVVMADGDRGPTAAFRRGAEPVLLPVNRLPAVQTVHAMTVHRGQGSQFRRVSVLLPPADSPLLSRELLYTAVTRAQRFVRVLGTEESVRAAVERPVVRASGLRRR